MVHPKAMVLSKVTHSILADTKGMKSRLQGQSHFTALQRRTERENREERGDKGSDYTEVHTYPPKESLRKERRGRVH